MKKKLFAFILAMGFLSSEAQAPQGITYQAVVRNAENELVSNTVIGIKVGLIEGSADGAVLYEETHSSESNQNGLISFVIGHGTTVSGSFAEINWADGPFFIKTEFDPDGGSNYFIEGVSEIMSVPYAFFAEKANGVPAPGTQAGEMLYWDGNHWIGVPPGQHGQFLSFCNGMPSWERCPAIVITKPVSPSFGSAAMIGGEVTDEGGSYVSERGLCWSVSPNPTVDNNSVSIGGFSNEFYTSITGLTPHTTYYVRAWAINLGGIAYGNEVSFVAGSAICGEDSLTDIDGNTYTTVVIDNQCWMSENLKATTYRNGTAITFGASLGTWIMNTTGAYAWYGNNASNKELYGALYNWFAVNNQNGLCPTGWKVPTSAEWLQLANYVDNITSTGGNKLKSCRQVDSPLGGDCNTEEHPRWNSHPVQYGTDDHDFSAHPGGRRDANGTYQYIGENAEWWTSTESNADLASYRRIVYLHSGFYGGQINKRNGFSVRCLLE